MEAVDYKKIQTDVDNISVAVVRSLEKDIRIYLDKCGLLYKIFMRIKSGYSLTEKLKRKFKEEGPEYRLRDLAGIRIVVYFQEDVAFCEQLILKYFEVVKVSKDKGDAKSFGPKRINYVCRMPEDVKENFDDKIWEYPIDPCFEIQIRTIFSEGWHEIDHDFRYKCQNEWEEVSDLSRAMNGILATLENCDWAISSLFTQVAYRHYKAGEWIPMLKDVFKIRITDCDDMDELLQYFDTNREVAKSFFRLDREEFLIELSSLRWKCPLRLCNVIFLANLFQIHDSNIEIMTPEALRRTVLDFKA